MCCTLGRREGLGVYIQRQSAYDAASNRTGFTDPESGATSYVYDTLNRLQTLTPPTAFSGTGNFGFSYDMLSRRTQMTRPNGLKSVYTFSSVRGSSRPPRKSYWRSYCLFL